MKLLFGSLLVTAAIIIGALFLLTGDKNTETKKPVILDPSTYVRDAGYNVTGSQSPSVLIVEFADFECPACALAAPVLKQAVEAYPDDVTLMYRYFPLAQHPNAREAAAAAEAAGRQGKFWEMYDLLFENQKDLKSDIYVDFATQLGLDIDQFKADMESDEVKAVIQADVDAGLAINISSTPTLIVNGEMITGAPDYNGLVTYIEQMRSAQQQVMDQQATDAAEPVEATPSEVLSE